MQIVAITLVSLVEQSVGFAYDLQVLSSQQYSPLKHELLSHIHSEEITLVSLVIHFGYELQVLSFQQ